MTFKWLLIIAIVALCVIGYRISDAMIDIIALFAVVFGGFIALGLVLAYAAAAGNRTVTYQPPQQQAWPQLEHPGRRVIYEERWPEQLTQTPQRLIDAEWYEPAKTLPVVARRNRR